jgi:hypothetical protein
MRLPAALSVCVVLASAPVHTQDHGAAKATGAGPRGTPPAVKPAAPKAEAPKPAVEPAKAPAAKPAAVKPHRSLEEAAEAIAAALAARAGAPRPPRVMGGAPAPRAAAPTYRGPRYQVRWPDLQWEVEWPAESERLSLDWAATSTD